MFSEPVNYNRSGVQMAPYRQAAVSVPGKTMRNVGRGLAIGGVPLLVAGIAMVSSADEYYYTTRTGPGGTYEDGDPKGAYGSLLTAAGTGMVVTGVVLWTTGAKKMRRHRNKDISISQGPKTVSLTYRF